MSYSKDGLKNVVVDHINWDDFDEESKNKLIKEICKRILKLEEGSL